MSVNKSRQGFKDGRGKIQSQRINFDYVLYGIDQLSHDINTQWISLTKERMLQECFFQIFTQASSNCITMHCLFLWCSFFPIYPYNCQYLLILNGKKSKFQRPLTSKLNIIFERNFHCLADLSRSIKFWNRSVVIGNYSTVR